MPEHTYKSSIKTFNVIAWMFFTLIFLCLCFSIDETVSALLQFVIIAYTLYLVLRSSFLLDTLIMNKDGIFAHQHFIWGYSKKKLYKWGNINSICFAKEQKRIQLVLLIENESINIPINHLLFDPEKAGEIINMYSCNTHFSIKDFVNDFQQHK